MARATRHRLLRGGRNISPAVVALSAAIVAALAGIYLLFNSQTLSEAERSWCDEHMSQVAVAAMQVSPRPSGLIGEAIAEHGASRAFWESASGGVTLGELWRSSDPDTFNRACKFAVAFAKERSR
ncbi:MAG TPA: hypothetical protein VEX62_11680 [Candidatus Limnocylindrales bacterium]|nr:hypothetical protein [Candidatus Limnocylindrales bacterium]